MYRVTLLLVACLSGCSAFTSVRSAEVRPGPSFTAQAAVSSPPGDDAAWFYSFDCADHCNQPVGALDLSLATGFRRPNGKTGSIGIGTQGLILLPYLDGYLQLGGSPQRPFGVGARIGLPLFDWAEHRLYGRFDFPGRNASDRYLWNPGVVLYTGNSPNGLNPGSVFGIANGFGVQRGTGRVVWTPSLSVVIARAERKGYSVQYGPTWSAFITAGASVTFQRKK